VNREPTLNDLIGDEATGAERQQLQHVHEMLLEAGPPPELSAELEAGPTLGMTLGHRRRKTKRRMMLLLAAAIAVFAVFTAGYASHTTGKVGGPQVVFSQELKGTSLAPQAEGALQVLSSQDGNNWPMKLTVVGLRQLPPGSYYEVYLLRNGKPWGLCGAFRAGTSPQNPVTVTLTAPYSPYKGDSWVGDSWVVTRPGQGGTEPGQTVLKPVTA
jgi:hypothetical protein